MRMSGQTADASELVKLVGWQQPEPEQDGIERWSIVPLRRKEDVACVGAFSRSRSSLRNNQLMISNELKLVPMCPDHAPAIM